MERKAPHPAQGTEPSSGSVSRAVLCGGSPAVSRLLLACPHLWVGSAAVIESTLYGSTTQRPTTAIQDHRAGDPTAEVVDLHIDNRLYVPPTPDDTHDAPIIVRTMELAVKRSYRDS